MDQYNTQEKSLIYKIACAAYHGNICVQFRKTHSFEDGYDCQIEINKALREDIIHKEQNRQKNERLRRVLPQLHQVCEYKAKALFSRFEEKVCKAYYSAVCQSAKHYKGTPSRYFNCMLLRIIQFRI